MTGRKGRVVTRKNGSVQYELRSTGDVPLELLNIAEKKRFMGGEKVRLSQFAFNSLPPPPPPSPQNEGLSSRTK